MQPSNTQPPHTQATIPKNTSTSSFHLSPTPILTQKLELHGCLFRSRAAPPPTSQTRESYCFLKRSMMRNWNRERCPFISFDRSSSKSDGRVGIFAKDNRSVLGERKSLFHVFLSRKAAAQASTKANSRVHAGWFSVGLAPTRVQTSRLASPHNRPIRCVGWQWWLVIIPSLHHCAYTFLSSLPLFLYLSLMLSSVRLLAKSVGPAGLV